MALKTEFCCISGVEMYPRNGVGSIRVDSQICRNLSFQENARAPFPSLSLRNGRAHLKYDCRVLCMPVQQTDRQKVAVKPLGLEDAKEPPLNLYKPKEPYTATIVSVERIVGPKAPGETCHIVIDHGGNVPYWEGQSYGVIPPSYNRTVVWSNDLGHTTRDHVHTLISGNMVPEDVVDVFVLMLLESMKSIPYPYKVRATIVRPMILSYSLQDHSSDGYRRLMQPVADVYDSVDMVFMPIVRSRHYNLLVLDKERKEYYHYSSMKSPIYDKNALAMRALFDKFLSSTLNVLGSECYPINHVRDCPQQKMDSLDCLIFVMRFMEQILNGEKLRLPIADVRFIRLQFALKIIMDGMTKPKPSSNEGSEKNLSEIEMIEPEELHSDKADGNEVLATSVEKMEESVPSEALEKEKESINAKEEQPPTVDV